jgi:hypothetical protein
MRERLAELNRPTQLNSLKSEIHRDVVDAFNPKPSEGSASAPISAAEREKKAG